MHTTLNQAISALEKIEDTPMVAVYWIDSFTPTSGAWVDPEEYKEPIYIFNIGFWEGADDDNIYLYGGNHEGSDAVMSFVAIPRGCIKGITELDVGKTLWKVKEKK